MKYTIAAVVLGLAAISGIAQANERATDVRLVAMSTLPGTATRLYAPRASIEPALVASDAASSIGKQTLNIVTDKLNRQLEQNLANAVAAAQ